MATFRAMFVGWIITLILVCYAGTSRAQEMTESEGECCNGTLNGKTWTYGNYIEAGLWGQGSVPVYTLPNEFESLTLVSGYATGMYGWGRNEGEGVAGITLKLGFQCTRATTNDDREVSETLGIAAPGAFIGWYLGERLVLTTGANVPISVAGPGIEVDIKASVLILDWFAIDFGVPAGFYRTGIDLDGKSVNTFALGFGIGARIELYGEYALY